MDQVEEVKQKNDIVEVVGSYLDLKKAGVNYKTSCPFHKENDPSFMVNPERQIFKCFGCFPKGSLIKTEDNYIPIEKIEKGNKVWTHKGRLKRVNYRFERNFEGQMVMIKPRMINKEIKLTEDHKVFAIRTKNCKQANRESRICQKRCAQRCPTKYFNDYKIEKIKAGELTKNDYLLYPLTDYEDSPKEIDLEKFIDKKPKHGKNPRDIDYNIKIDKDFVRLAGLYIAEGSSNRAYIRFSLGPEEEGLANEITQIIKRVFGLDSGIHIRKGKKTGIEVSCCHSYLAQIFPNLFGKCADNKKIHSFLMGLPNRLKKVLIKALVDGDGHRTSIRKNQGPRTSYDTISNKLAHQIIDTLLHLGVRPSFTYNDEWKSNNGIHHKESYQLSWKKENDTHFSDFLTWQGHKYWILPISKISKKQVKQRVYNLNVSDDHSYLSESFMVGNCGESGDVISFIQEMEGVDFPDALKILADRAGIKLKKIDRKEFKKKKDLYQINDLATEFYQYVLNKLDVGKKAKKYLKERGISKEMTSKFQLGYAPKSWQSLFNFLSEKKDIDQKQIIKAGLANKSEKGRVYDRFRGRIIFPILNPAGRIIGFSSRILPQYDDKKMGKYINSPDSPIFDKSKTLYGKNFASKEIREKEKVILVEGQFDVISSHQHGFENTIATSGTALTKTQIDLIANIAPTIIFAFDRDSAGQEAIKKGIDLALAANLEVKIALIPGKFDDVDEVVQADPDLWQKALDESKEIIEYYFAQTIPADTSSLTSNQKRKIGKTLIKQIGKITDPIIQGDWLQKLSDKLEVDSQFLNKSLEEELAEQSRSSTYKNKQEKQETEAKDASEDPERRILGLILEFNQIFDKIEDRLTDKHFSKKKLRDLFTEIKKKGSNNVGKKFKKLADGLVLEIQEDYQDQDEETAQQEAEQVIKKLKQTNKEEIKKDYATKIKKAEKKGDIEQVKKLIKQFQKSIK